MANLDRHAPSSSSGWRSHSPSASPSPAATTAATASSTSTATQKKKRLSLSERFLPRFFRRLIPPFSPTSSSTSSHPSQSEGTTTDTETTQTQSNKTTEDQGETRRPRRNSNASSSNTATTTTTTTTADGGNQTKVAAIPETCANVMDKENERPLLIDGPITDSLEGLSLKQQHQNDASPPKPTSPASLRLTADGLKSSQPKPKSIHQEFMDQALDMARLALRTNETPVGCVLVHKDKVIAKGMNATNVTRNGTRHAEYMALSALLSRRSEETAADCTVAEPRYIPSESDPEALAARQLEKDAALGPDPSLNDPDYVKQGHLYPYGQKLVRDSHVHRDVVSECSLYVTVEPCVMCAGLLRQLGIRKVYFGAVNDKFGGAGGVFSIHLNSIGPKELAKKNAAEAENGETTTPAVAARKRQESKAEQQQQQQPLGVLDNDQQPQRPAIHGPEKPPQKSVNGQYHQPLSNPDGDGGNVERGFEIEGGWGRDEAVGLLRRFYVQENGRAPQPRKKEGRAARLAALEQGVTPPEPPVPHAQLVTSGTPGETGAGDAAAEVDKTALDAEIAEIPLQERVLKGKRVPFGEIVKN